MFSSHFLTRPPALLSRQKIDASLADGSISSRRKLVDTLYSKPIWETSPKDLAMQSCYGCDGTDIRYEYVIDIEQFVIDK